MRIKRLSKQRWDWGMQSKRPLKPRRVSDFGMGSAVTVAGYLLLAIDFGEGATRCEKSETCFSLLTPNFLSF
jgi:hypothetical protein